MVPQGIPGQQRHVQTLTRAYAAIAAHMDPWVALNEFFHEWWDYSRTDRVQLVSEEVLPGGPSVLLGAPPTPERERRWRWAVFCAAAAEYLCARDGVAPPAWVADPRYTLAEPWYHFGAREPLTPEARTRLERATPDPLRRRNILCGDRVFANKYEFVAQIQGLMAARRRLPGSAKGRLGKAMGDGSRK